MSTVYLLLGGNTGNRLWFIEQAYTMLALRVGHVRNYSMLYETKPWGFSSSDTNNFINKIVVLETRLSPLKLLNEIKKIEVDLGRCNQKQHLSINQSDLFELTQKREYEDRNMDIDILLYNDWIVCEPNLIIPHLQLHKRRFALTPLCEVAPNVIHPLFNKSVACLLAECDDNLEVKPLE